ncbi:MAG: hypothetical protein H8E94_08350 [Alphaproteobacteria bacterium]|nr:hypothetical protein [Alphaproteobacteria bacterium]
MHEGLALIFFGVSVVGGVLALFYFKDRLRSYLLARMAYSQLTARLALLGAACVVVGFLLAIGG